MKVISNDGTVRISVISVKGYSHAKLDGTEASGKWWWSAVLKAILKKAWRTTGLGWLFLFIIAMLPGSLSAQTAPLDTVYTEIDTIVVQLTDTLFVEHEDTLRVEWDTPEETDIAFYTLYVFSDSARKQYFFPVQMIDQEPDRWQFKKEIELETGFYWLALSATDDYENESDPCPAVPVFVKGSGPGRPRNFTIIVIKRKK